MEADTAWRVTGFVLRMSSWFYMACALVFCCSAHENHEGGEYNITILAAVQADLLSTTQHRQDSGRLLFGMSHVGSAGRPHFLCFRSLFFSSSPSLLLLSYFLLCMVPQHQHQKVWRLFHSPVAISTQAELFVFYIYTR